MSVSTTTENEVEVNEAPSANDEIKQLIQEAFERGERAGAEKQNVDSGRDKMVMFKRGYEKGVENGARVGVAAGIITLGAIIGVIYLGKHLFASATKSSSCAIPAVTPPLPVQ